MINNSIETYEYELESNIWLHNAKTAKNDEYYTRYEDIEAELSNYSSFFSGKSVFCPCDDYDISNFVKYFKSNFEALGLKALYSSCIDVQDGNPKKMEYYGKGNPKNVGDIIRYPKGY